MMETPESMEVDVISQPQTVGSCTETVHVRENYRHHSASPAESNLHQYYSWKRIQRSSPFPSPHKLTRSPATKTRRLQTGTEKQTTKDTNTQNISFSRNVQHLSQSNAKEMSLSDFQTNETESTAFSEFLEDINTYMLHKYAVHKSTPDKTFLGMQEYFQ